jgi:hypothetical protein
VCLQKKNMITILIIITIIQNGWCSANPLISGFFSVSAFVSTCVLICTGSRRKRVSTSHGTVSGTSTTPLTDGLIAYATGSCRCLAWTLWHRLVVGLSVVGFGGSLGLRVPTSDLLDGTRRHAIAVQQK